MNEIMLTGVRAVKIQCWYIPTVYIHYKYVTGLFVRGIHSLPVNSPHTGQWRGALMFSLIFAWTNGWANNRYAGDVRRHRAHYGVTITMYHFCYIRDRHIVNQLLQMMHRVIDVPIYLPYPWFTTSVEPQHCLYTQRILDNLRLIFFSYS